MADTIREQIISAMHSKIAKIRVKWGYNSECGKNPFRGVPVPVHDDFLPGVSVAALLEAKEGRGGRDLKIMQVRVQGVRLFTDDENPSEVSETILGDLIECIQGAVWTLGFDSGGTYHPAGGDAVLGATSAAVAVIQSVGELDSGAFADGDAAGDLELRRVEGDFENNEELTIAGNAGAATVDGTASVEDAVTLTTSGLADYIEYVSGGLDSYPQQNEHAVGAQTVFYIAYKTKTGNPYSQ